MELPVRFDAESVRATHEEWLKISAQGKSTVMLGHRVTFADSTALAMLSRVAKDLRVEGLHLVIAEPSISLWHALEVMRVDAVLDVCGRLTEGMRILEQRRREETVLLNATDANVINWQGEVTAGNANEIWSQTEAVMTATEQSGRRKLKIDLSTVRFVDSTGVGLMVRAKKQCNARGIDIRFERPSKAASSVIRTLRMETFLLGNTPALSA